MHKIMKLNAVIMAICCLLLTNASFAKTTVAMKLAKENTSMKKTIANYGKDLLPSVKESLSYCSEKMKNRSPQEANFKEDFVACMENHAKDTRVCLEVAAGGTALCMGGTVCEATWLGIPVGVLMQIGGGAALLGAMLADPSGDMGDPNTKKCEYKMDKFIKKVTDNPILYCDADEYTPCIEEVYTSDNTDSERKLEKACRWANSALRAFTSCGAERAFTDALDICDKKGGCQTQPEYFEALDQAYNWL